MVFTGVKFKKSAISSVLSRGIEDKNIPPQKLIWLTEPVSSGFILL